MSAASVLDCRYCHTGVETSRGRRDPADAHLHDLPLAALHPDGDAGAGARESRRRPGRSIGTKSTSCRTTSISIIRSISPRASGCTTCHGDVAHMPLMRQAAPLTMDWCLDCHRDPAPNLRPAAAVFARRLAISGRPGARRGAMLAHHNIDNRHLTDCSVCSPMSDACSRQRATAPTPHRPPRGAEAFRQRRGAGARLVRPARRAGRPLCARYPSA